MIRLFDPLYLGFANLVFVNLVADLSLTAFVFPLIANRFSYSSVDYNIYSDYSWAYMPWS